MIEKKIEKYIIALAEIFNKKLSVDKKEKYLIALASLFHSIESFYSMENLKEDLSHIFSQEEITFLIEKANYFGKNESELPDNNLRSIFRSIKLNAENQYKNNINIYLYKVTPLRLNDDIFPVEKRNLQNVSETYKIHKNNFREEFSKKLKDINLKFKEHPEKVFSLIYHLFYKYSWCIPVSNKNLDISLFDNSRVLSAVACCLYDYVSSQHKEETERLKNEKTFLHLKADISGIQKFIYNVYQGKGGVAKILRGRSFYIALLPEILSRYILNELEYPISNLLYCGGGIFEILVANTEKNKEKLKDMQIKIEKFLAKQFEADLGLSIGIYQYSFEEMTQNYKNVLRKLNENLDNAKKSKFKSLIDSGEIFKALNERSNQIHSNKKKCPVCQTYLINENLEGDKEICDVCNTFWKIGHHLSKTEILVFSKERIQSFIDNDKIINFDDFGSVYFITKDNKIDLQSIFLDSKTTEILSINNTEIPKYTTGFKFMGKVVPIAIKNILPEETEEEDTIHEGQIAPFTVLSQYSEGDKKIGILRMDVDNLGKLFSKGLEEISISKIATLSRMLDLFFAGYLNKICKKLSDKYLPDSDEDKKIDSLFYILYSGGDDLFIVAPWDKTIEIALEINEKFKKFTCYNPDITLSAGYIQTKPKFPIRVSADIAGEAEDVAKKAGKNRICVLGDVFKWEDLKNIKEKAEEWSKKINNNELQRGFIYAVHRLKEQFLKDETRRNKLVFPYKKEENPMFYPYAQYYIARNIKGDELKENVAKFLLNKENFNKLTFVINYVALKTRK